MIRRRYADGRFGQLHIRENMKVAGSQPLACLHATAYSSRTFIPLLKALDGRRYALAPDTPGYGESDAPPEPISISTYAEAVAEVLPAQFDLFGYHSGVSIAVEIAIAIPDRVGQLFLMGVPYFQALDFDSWRERLTAKHELGDALAQFTERWDYLVTKRPQGLSLRRGFENFIDELKAWPNGWWAHQSLFAHSLAERLPLVRQKVITIIPPGHLADPSRRAAEFLADGLVIDLPEMTGAALELHSATIARIVEATGS